MKDYQKLEDYFSIFLKDIDPDNRSKLTEVFRCVNEEYWTHPAASGSHHNSLQSKEHGLMYHVYEGLINLNQFIRARSDLMKLYTDMGDEYEGTKGKAKDGRTLGMPEIDLNVGYLLHDICKFKVNPSGSNYTHDEDAYHWLKGFGFNPVILMIVRFTHGQWSTGLKYKRDFRGTKYEDLVWLSHYADMSASSQTDIKFIDADNPYKSLPDFNKDTMKVRKDSKDKTNIDIKWWNNPKVVINETNEDDTPKTGTMKDQITTASINEGESW